MRYKDDWHMAKKRLEAFWQGEIIDRCCISLRAPRDGASTASFDPLPASSADRLSWWTDTERVMARERFRMEHTYFAGEAVPAMDISLGAAGHAGFFKGADYRFEDSLWFFPSLEDPDELEFDENSFLYQKMLEMARAFAQDSRGDYMINLPPFNGNADALSHLMGPEMLLPAMIEEPESVTRAMNKMQAALEKALRAVHEITAPVNDGGSLVGWLNTWGPGFHGQMQCDLSVMISNPLFRQFIVPELTAQCRMYDQPLYHFDGIEQIRHLDDLLAIPNLKAIQWTQVAGQPPCTAYLPELKKIQAAGKNLVIISDARQIPELLKYLSPKGLFFVSFANSPQEADDLIRTLSRAKPAFIC